jgi:hypothetical protein
MYMYLDERMENQLYLKSMLIDCAQKEINLFKNCSCSEKISTWYEYKGIEDLKLKL